MRIGIGGPALQPLDELILVFRGAVDLPFLRPPLQPRVHLRGRDAALLREANDVLVVRDALRTREFADDVADRDDLLPLRLTDAGLDDVDVESAFLAGDLAHPVLDDAHGSLCVVCGNGLAQTEASARLGEADDGFELARRDGDAGARRFSGPSNIEVLLLDDPHGLLCRHRIDALRIAHVLPEEIRIEVWRVGFLEAQRLPCIRARLLATCDFFDPMTLENMLRELTVPFGLRAIDHEE